MGLVVENIPVHVPTVVCTEGSGSSLWNETVSMDNSFYRIFNMRNDMKVLTRPVITKNEFDLFIEYAEALTIGNEYEAGFDAINTNLGNIGVIDGIC